MFKFKITKDKCKELIAICGQISSIADKAKPIYELASNKLSFYLYSQTIIFQTDLDVETVETEQETNNFFSLSTSDFISTIQNVSEQENYDVTIIVDNDTNQVSFKNEVTGTSISRSSFESQITSEEVSEAKDAIKDKLANEFGEESKDIKITSELINFVDTMAKLMNVTNSSNSVNINNDTVKYADALAIVEKKLSESLSSSDSDIRICKELTDFVKPFVKVAGSINATLRGDDMMAYVASDEFNFKSIISFPIPSYEYPDEDSFNSFVADPNDCVEIEINKEDLLSAFTKFEGVFVARNWNWKVANIDANNASLNSGSVRIHHNDYMGAVETYVPVNVIKNNERELNFTDGGVVDTKKTDFIFSIFSLSDVLSIVSEDKINISFSRLATNEEHGSGITIKTPTLLACVCKISDSNL